MILTTPNLVNDNASFGMKRVSDGITKHGDTLKVDDPHHPEENQVFDVSEFPGYTGKGGYGVAHKVPVKQADGTIKMVDKGVPPVKNFTLIRSEEEHTHTEVTNNQPGVISAGGDIVINGASSNINSKIASAGQVIFNGAHETVSDTTSDKLFKTGTTQVSESKRVHKGHGLGHKWRRYWDPEVFMTPSIEEQNIQPIGTIQEHAEDTIAEANKRKVNDSLDPFGTGNQGKSSIGNVTIEGLKLPTQAIYIIHPDITVNALIETDSAFINRKKFVSSEYMLNALANDPERRMKRLGDGFYEQGLINSQILSATGKPYLEGYTDNESEYKALLEAGISYGKKYKLTPGITLSEEQMKSITTDMVWLETKTIVVNGQPQQVLYPKVYLAKQSAKQIDAMGAVVSGKSIIVNTDSTFKNSGNMMADSIVVQANTVDNTGRFNANTVAIGATDSIRNTGAIHGNDSVTLRANNDISVEAATHKLANQDVLVQQGRIGVSNPKGTIDIHSNKDVHLTGAIITGRDEGNISITSANTVNVDTKKLSAKKDMTLNAANYLRTDRGTEIGTQILGDGNVTVVAKNDVNIRQGVINSEHGVTTIAAGNDVNIENGNTYSRDQYGLQYKEKGLLSRTVNTIRKDYEHTGVTASTIGGNTIQVGANHDVNVTGSNVLGTGDVAITAGNKVHTNSGEDSSRNDTYQHSKKKGLMGAGLGFTIGSKQIKDTEAGSYTTNVNTLIGSVDGTIAINANNDAHITSTDIVGKHGITVSAADITLDGNHDVAMLKQVHEEKQSGLTVSLGGSIASALNTAHGLQRKASSRNDKRLATLENIEAGKELKKGYEQIKEYQEFTPEFVKRRAESLIESSKIKKNYVAQIDKELKKPNLSNKDIRRLEKDRNRLAQEANQEHAEGTNDLQDINSKDQKQYNAKKRAKKDGLANIHVSIGSSKSRSETTLNSRNYAGGQLVSDDSITLVAKPNMQDKGNVVAVSETIRGKTVALEASNDISLLAATNTSEKQVAYDSKGWSIGANLSVNGGGLLGLDANYNQGMERGNTFTTTHTGTVIQADQVNLHSGKDTTIAGSKVYGDSVTAEIGGNLAIKSLQDIETYRGKSKNVGFSVSTNGLQLGSVSAEYTNGTMKSDYASVADQAGIYAGTGGFAIQSKGNTTLEGAVIGSKATADKNSLVTDSLTIKDIKNKAEYTSSNTGLSYTSVSGFKNLSQAGKDALYNSLGLLPKLLPDSSKSSESTTKSAIANGTIKAQSSNIDIDKISRDTESSLNKLDTIFDKKKVEERQELARLFAKDAFEQLHYWQPKTKEEKIAKALAHAVVAESSARIAGNPAGSGFYAGLSNEALIGEIQKISKTNPAVAQWLSAALGAVVNGVLDKPIITGAMESQNGTKYNAYGRMKQPRELDYTESYDFIDLYGNTWRRRRSGDSRINPENIRPLAVVQTAEEGHQLEGQEVWINSDGSWTNINEPMGNVHLPFTSSNPFRSDPLSEGERAEKFLQIANAYEEANRNKPYVVDTWRDRNTNMAYNQYSDGTIVPLGLTWGQVLEQQGYSTTLGSDGAFYTGSSATGWYYNPNPSESSRHRIVWQGYQADDGQYYNLLADGSKVLTGEYKGNYNAKAGQAIEFNGETGKFYSGGFPVYPDGDKDLIRLTSWVEFKADLNYAGETGMLIAGGNSLGRGVLPRGVKAGNSRQNSGNVVRYAREYPKTEKGYYGTSSKNSSQSSIREIPGGEKEARRFFETISKGGKIKPTNNPDNIMKEMPDGRIIQFRPKSKSGDAAVDISKSEEGPRQKIHFPE